MKTLILVRHAKSSWSDPTLHDRDRPLNDRGRRDAAAIGRRLAQAQKPELIVSSPARRALKTGRVLARKLHYRRRDIQVVPALYGSAVREMLQTVRNLPERHACIMLIGHNPELTALAHRFSRQITRMPTCAVAILSFNVDSWADVSRSALAQVIFDYPKRVLK